MNEKMRKFYNEVSKTWDLKIRKPKEYFDKFVKDNFHLEEGMRVIDLACGTGIITQSIYEITHSDVLGIDLSDGMIDRARSKNTNPHIRFVAEDFYDSSHRDFDAIVCCNSYPHFINKEAFVQKCASTLKPGGLLIIAHSNSKDNINEHHKNVERIDACQLIDADKEALLYKEYFNIVDTKDNDIYLIVLKKK